MNPLNHPTDSLAALAVLVLFAWLGLAVFVAIMMQQPNDGE